MSHETPFTVGDTEFAAVRFHQPCDHWRVKLTETGEVLEAGTAGISTASKPKMQQDLEDLLRRDGDVDLFRRGFRLPLRVARVRDLADRVGVDARYDEAHETWACRHEDGSEQVHFQSEAAALMAGVRKSDTLQDFLLTEKRYVCEDDTLLVVHAEQWLGHHAKRTP